MAHKLTDEQLTIIREAGTGKNLVLCAGAGAGKTSTLVELAKSFMDSRPGEKILYLAYNRTTRYEAIDRMPGNTDCHTSGSLSYASKGRKYKTRLDNKARLSGQAKANILNVNEPARIIDDPNVPPFAPAQLARIAVDTVKKFCYSADFEISSKHVPHVERVVTPAERAALAKVIVPIAERAWVDLKLEHGGKLEFDPDHVLKMYQLGKPVLRKYAVIMLDEAQDTNECVMDIINRQKCQVILVGDENQAIYQWRGAINAMKDFPGLRLTLSQSFRFGPEAANEANKWLGLLGSNLRLRGFDAKPTVLAPLQVADAILCRTNAGAMAEVIRELAAGRRVHLVGGGDAIKNLAFAALDLQARRPTSHPELFLFQTWGEVQDYVAEDASGSDLKVFVKLIDTYGADKIIDVCKRLIGKEQYADVTVSTAHKAKGREWSRVRIGEFPDPTDEDNKKKVEPTAEDFRLAYVAVTRGMVVLDRGGLGWVDKYIADEAPHLLAQADDVADPGAVLATAAGR